MITLSTDLFSYKDRTFTAEISSLKGYGDVTNGIRLRNPKTGGQVIFRFDNVVRDREGDVLTINLVSTDAPDLYITLFND